jgi:hypothetical protein
MGRPCSRDTSHLSPPQYFLWCGALRRFRRTGSASFVGRPRAARRMETRLQARLCAPGPARDHWLHSGNRGLLADRPVGLSRWIIVDDRQLAVDNFRYHADQRCTDGDESRRCQRPDSRTYRQMEFITFGSNDTRRRGDRRLFGCAIGGVDGLTIRTLSIPDARPGIALTSVSRRC